MNMTLTCIAPLAEWTVWQCPDCLCQEQHQKAESAETLHFCRSLAQDWSRICGRRMVRTFVAGPEAAA